MALDHQHRSAIRNPRLWAFFIAVALVVVLLAAFVSRRRGEVYVRADQANIQNLANTISTNGKVEPMDNFEAHAPAPTTVKKIFVKEGQWVKAGTMLIQLNDADARAQAARALAQLRAAEADLHATKAGGTQEEVLSNESQLSKAQTERDAAQRSLQALEKLERTGAAAPGEVQEARNRLTRAESDLKLLQQKQTQRFSRPEIEKVQASAAEAQASYAAAQNLLRDANVRAPRDGMVYSIPVREGEFVQQGELLLQVANLKNVQVRAFVDEPEIGSLSVNQPVTITWDALPGKTWSGKTSQVPYTGQTRATTNVGAG